MAQKKKMTEEKELKTLKDLKEKYKALIKIGERKIKSKNKDYQKRTIQRTKNAIELKLKLLEMIERDVKAEAIKDYKKWKISFERGKRLKYPHLISRAKGIMDYIKWKNNLTEKEKK